MKLANPLLRGVIYLLIGSLLPLGIILSNYTRASHKLDLLTSLTQSLRDRILLQENKLSFNRKVIEFYRGKDRFYIQKYLQPLKFLTQEEHQLQRLQEITAIPKDPKISQRLEKISHNSMVFSEGSVTKNLLFQEIPETLVRPVEIDEGDLLHLLSLLEGVEIGDYSPPKDRPHIMVTDFKVERKKSSLEEELFQLNFKLIKREYL